MQRQKTFKEFIEDKRNFADDLATIREEEDFSNFGSGGGLNDKEVRSILFPKNNFTSMLAAGTGKRHDLRDLIKEECAEDEEEDVCAIIDRIEEFREKFIEEIALARQFNA